MSDPFRTIGDYELFLYHLPEQFSTIQRSTLVLSRRGATLARVAGELSFDHGFRLVLRERLVYHRLPVVIDSDHLGLGDYPPALSPGKVAG